MAAFEPGDLDRTLVFKAPGDGGSDALNEPVKGALATIATVRARRTAVSDAERVKAIGVQRDVSDRFVTHWSSTLADLDLTQLAVCEGVTYDLVGRKELGRREGLEWSMAARPDLQAAS